jgi:hypothetical protein
MERNRRIRIHRTSQAMAVMSQGRLRYHQQNIVAQAGVWHYPRIQYRYLPS